MLTLEDLDEMQLPAANPRKDKSKEMRNRLSLAIRETVDALEKDSGYKFEPYEVDAVLLEHISRRHEAYINARFKDGK